MFFATRYVKIDGVIFTKGEVIEGELDEGKKEWLLKAGAIEEVAPEKAKPAPETAETAPAPETAKTETEDTAFSVDAREIDVMDGVIDAKPKPKKKGGKRK